jgi:hypothetical protein
LGGRQVLISDYRRDAAPDQQRNFGKRFLGRRPIGKSTVRDGTQ